MSCETCPFAFSEASEMVQNYGCLPEPADIIRMKRESGHNWSCHYNGKKKCQGFVDFVKEAKENKWMVDNLEDIDTNKGGIISYDTWETKGEKEAIKEAEESHNDNGKQSSL